MTKVHASPSSTLIPSVPRFERGAERIGRATSILRVNCLYCMVELVEIGLAFPSPEARLIYLLTFLKYILLINTFLNYFFN